MSTGRIELGHERRGLPPVCNRKTRQAASSEIDTAGVVARDRHVPATIDRNGSSYIQSAVREVLGPLMDARRVELRHEYVRRERGVRQVRPTEVYDALEGPREQYVIATIDGDAIPGANNAQAAVANITKVLPSYERTRRPGVLR